MYAHATLQSATSRGRFSLCTDLFHTALTHALVHRLTQDVLLPQLDELRAQAAEAEWEAAVAARLAHSLVQHCQTCKTVGLIEHALQHAPCGAAKATGEQQEGYDASEEWRAP